MKQKAIWTLALLCTVAQGFGAVQITEVSTEVQLIDAISQGDKNIQLTENILLENYLNIDGKTVTIDLNGHKLYRNLSEHGSQGHVIWAHNGSNLTLTSSVAGGSIEGGMANNGGAIHIPHGNTVSATNVIFRNNSAADHAGAIWNNGTFTATNCTFENNKASDVGGIYNSVTTEGAGTATLKDCTFTGNKGTTGAGALANALGATAMTINDCTITDNIASGHGGGIWNGGTLTVTNSAFTNNTANDVGGIYNAVSDDGAIAGSATLTDCTFTGNKGTAGAGALANALGETVMTIEGGTIRNNTADTYGAGIWNGGTLNMKGVITVQDNTNVGGMVSNVYLKNDKVITVTGSLTGSSIGVEMESVSGTFTSGFSNYDHVSGFLFTPDRSSIVSVIRYGDEIELVTWYSDPVTYIERSWDDTNKKVVSTEKSLTTLIAYGDEPVEGQYKEVTNAPDNKPDEWFGMGGFSTSVPEYYVVRGDVKRQTIVVQGKDVHLILCNGATLSLTGGLKLEGDNKLYIHSQSYGGDMGRLMVTNKYEKAAGIGSALHNGDAVRAGELVIYGGHIEATGGKQGAGIGSCCKNGDNKQLSNKVTIYGGFVKAQGGECAAGIGGGAEAHGGALILYDGTVIANGRTGSVNKPSSCTEGITSTTNTAGGAGVGGGGILQSDSEHHGGFGGDVTIYGGTLTATGSEGGAGIGSGCTNYSANKIYKDQPSGGTFTIYGGTVTATGGHYGAGIGGGFCYGGAKVYVHGGTLKTQGLGGGSGIGGGQNGHGGDVTITGGTVIAIAGRQGGTGNRAIGPGVNDDNYGTLTIGDAMMVGAGNNGTIESIFDADERKNACWFRTYAEISPCTHPSGVTYTIEGTDANGTHTSHCKHCGVSETAAHFNSDGIGTCICGYKDGEGYCTITVATSIDGAIYEGVGIMAKVGNNMPYTLPVCSSIPEGYDFAGWAVNPTNHNGIRPNGDEELKQAGENITVTGDISIFARYKALVISLADNSDNGETLYTYNGKNNASVTLTDRTLYKDGGWNTLCLPFSLTEAQVTAQLAPGELKTLSGSDFENGTLTLNFTNATDIEAGKPYIIKWTGGSDIVEPTFSGVTISNAYTPVETDYVDFVGTYSPIDIFTEFKTNLYLGADNLLYYPSGEDSFIINSFRAFFELKNGLTAGEPVSTSDQPIRSFVLNFGEETGIREISNSSNLSNSYFTLDGLRIGEKPSSPGLYIHNGTKILIK